MNIPALFEEELLRRGIPFTIDAKSGRHAIEIGGASMLISIDNLQRDVASDGDTGRVSRFVDALLASTRVSEGTLSAEQLYWCLEPNHYEQCADVRVAMSDRVDRVLVYLSVDAPLITWVTHAMLDSLGLSESAAGARAFANLGCALSKATLEFQDIDGVRLGFIATSLPFKASLLLAPNLREVAGDLLGWPLMAVAPDRDFLYLWAARHTDFVQRVAPVVVSQHSEAAYPISTEVYEITDQSIRAIGEFQRKLTQPCSQNKTVSDTLHLMISNSPAFEMWWSEYQRTASLGAVQLGVSRESLKALLGEPDAVGSSFRRQPNMGIWRFGPVEFHFDASGRLFLIYTEDDDGNGRVIATSDAARS